MTKCQNSAGFCQAAYKMRNRSIRLYDLIKGVEIQRERFLTALKTILGFIHSLEVLIIPYNSLLFPNVLSNSSTPILEFITTRHTGKWIQSMLDLFCDSASTAALTENDINQRLLLWKVL